MITVDFNKLCQPFIRIMQFAKPDKKEYYEQVITVAYHLGMEMSLEESEIIELMTAAALAGVYDETKNKNKVFFTIVHEHTTELSPFEKINQILQQVPTESPCNIVHTQANILYLSKLIAEIVVKEPILYHKKQLLQEIYHTYEGKIDPNCINKATKLVSSDIFLLRTRNQTVHTLFEKLGPQDVSLTIDDIVLFGVALAEIIDQRSTYTLNHSNAVAQLARLIGDINGFSLIDTHRLFVAGLLHDLGKVGIPEEIINKKQKLTDKEYSLIKEHPFYTYEILRSLESIEFFTDIVRWACSHHERNDGSGYLYGKDHTSIDKGSHVLIYADLIASLLEERPYRKAMTIEQVFEVLSDLVIRNKIDATIYDNLKQKKALLSETFKMISLELVVK